MQKQCEEKEATEEKNVANARASSEFIFLYNLFLYPFKFVNVHFHSDIN